MTTISPNTPVLIVGGGIVGLSASLFLSQHNIHHILVERHVGTSIHPRARGVNTRTMEIYRSLHLDEELRAAGAELGPSMGILRGPSLRELVEPRKRKEASTGSFKFPGSNLFDGASPASGARGTQDAFEPVLLKAAASTGYGDIRFYTECLSFLQDEHGVTATLRDQSKGTDSVIRAQYIIASDGAGSPIRKTLGVKTTGKGPLGHLLNILFHADLKDFVRNREFSLGLIERPEIHGLFTSINNSDRWVFHLCYEPSKGENAANFPPERCKNILKQALGFPEIDIQIKSILPWESTVRVAEKLQHGRIFLAGDAAHTMPPWAGQGANSGISDVHNLAWKLAAVITGNSNSKLLETYDTERLPVGQRAAYFSGELADESGLLSKRKMIMSAPLRIPMFFGFGYTYSSSAVIAEDTQSWFAWLWSLPWSVPSLLLGLNGSPGTRAPHVWINHGGKEISTVDLLGKSWVLISGADGKTWCEIAREAASELNVELEAYCAGPTGDLSDPKLLWQSAAGIPSSGAILIRPDGFVAWRVMDQAGGLKKHLIETLEKVLYL